MTKSTNIEVLDFRDKIMMLDNTKSLILEKLRKIVIESYPKVKERMMYGGIIFSLINDFGGIFVYKNHISFEFSYGYKLKDPEKLLEGSGKYRRHLKIWSIDSIEMKNMFFFITQIQLLDT